MTDAETIRFLEIMALPYFAPTIYLLLKGQFKLARSSFFSIFSLPGRASDGSSFVGWFVLS